MAGPATKTQVLQWMASKKIQGLDVDLLVDLVESLKLPPTAAQSAPLAQGNPREDDTITLSRPPRSIAVGPTLPNIPNTDHAGNAQAVLLPDRYEELETIGSGGVGEIRRVLDRHLNRPMAMKLLLPHMNIDPFMIDRFIEEAQVTAQLQHPGIVPVHDVGRLNDGRYYFTMKEVTGRTLKTVIRDVHKAINVDRWQPTSTGWTFRRLIDVFRRICETVAYAHSRGVVHRDLKPSNIMVGDFGEVLVLDWGLALVMAGSHTTVSRSVVGTPLTTLRLQTNTALTQVGEAPGTPSYMAPEQARGDSDKLGPWSDVYALGAILFQILSGRAPYRGRDAEEVVAQVLSESTPNVADILGPVADDLIPTELDALCQKAMAKDIEKRPRDANFLAKEIGDWLEGARRRERAIAVVQSVIPLTEDITKLRVQAKTLRNEAETYLTGVKGWEPIDRKRPGWDKEDEAADLEHEAALKEVAYLQGLRGALANEPNLDEAHERLARYYRELHEESERDRNLRTLTQAEEFLKAHDRTNLHQSYLKGDGRLSLNSEPPGAMVRLYRYDSEDRRLVPKFVKELGLTPLIEVRIPKGSYLLELESTTQERVRYPVFIERGQHWKSIHPDQNQAISIPLPKKGTLGPDDIYVPPGWFWSGGDKEAYLALPRRKLWLNGFVMSRFPVTNRAYLIFLNDLLARGQEKEALSWVPRVRPGGVEEEGPMIYGRKDNGEFRLRPDADGDMWLPEHPVLMISWYCARAYANWLKEKTGLAWRLPWELEWEKAARGVDGRIFPWGDSIDPTWTCIRASAKGHPKPVVVDSYPLDLSPYGVRGLGGNVQDWCADAFERTGPLINHSGVFEPDPREAIGDAVSRTYRGGAWFGPDRVCRVAHRTGDPSGLRTAFLGFRLARSL